LSRVASARRLNLAQALVDARPPGLEDRPALRGPWGEWSYGRLEGHVAAAAGWLRERGVRRGQTVALCLPDGPAWVAAFLGAVRLGAVCALLSPDQPGEHLAGLLEPLGARLLIAGADAPAGLPRADPGELEAALLAGLPDPGCAPTRPWDPCYLLATSGTTGASKWVVHRQQDIPFCLGTYGRHVLRLRPGDVTYSVAALPTSYGLGNRLYFPLGSGACAWIDAGRPSPAHAARACREGAVTVMLGVPTFWGRLARHAADGRVRRGDFSRVRLAVSAGEPLPPAVWRATRDALGLRLVNGLGSSEATNLYLSERPGSPRPGGVGWPVPGFEVRLAGPAGEPVAEGEVLVRGGSVMAGYLGDPAASARALDGGWLHTGDLARREPDGSYRLVGRLGDRVKIGGFWVDPARTQDLLAAQAGVAEAAVVAVPDALGLRRLAAVVAHPEGDGAALEEHLQAICRASLRPQEVPRALVVCEELPTTPSGKLRRREVVDMAAKAIRDAESRRGSDDGAEAALLARWNACGYYRMVGMEVTRADAGGSAFRLVVDERHLQAYGTAHGGVTTGLLDAAMGLAILGRIPATEGCATVEVKANFLAPVRPGELSATGAVVHAGRRLVVARAEARAGDDVVAVGLGTFARFPLESS
jgi:4-hydroxybenzoate adenylyltransferase